MASSTSVVTHNTAAESTTARAGRIVSIDIFRGLTMATMIFVNALPEGAELPWWTYHAHVQQDVMTYVDMVFPFFLFAIGLSLPLSIENRLRRNPSMPALWLHVVIRSLSLVVLGYILANAEKADATKMGFNGSLWALMALICAGLFLNVYPKSTRFPRYAQVLRVVGLASAIVLLALFRRTTQGGQVAWLDPSYPEILGLIGFSYLCACLLYIPTRRLRWAQLAWLVLLGGFCILSTARLIALPGDLPLYIWPFHNGAMVCLIMGGVITAQIVLDRDRRMYPMRAIGTACCFGVLMLVAGLICTPLGISKIRATPTWTFYCIGAAALVFALLYWVSDVKQWRRWAGLVMPAGSNTLTTYLLPDLWYFLFSALGITYLDTHFSQGSEAVIKTAVFTLLMLAAAGVLTKAKVRLQL